MNEAIKHLKAELEKLTEKSQKLKKEMHELEGDIADLILKNHVTGFAVYRCFDHPKRDEKLFEFDTLNEAEGYCDWFMDHRYGPGTWPNVYRTERWYDYERILDITPIYSEEVSLDDAALANRLFKVRGGI